MTTHRKTQPARAAADIQPSVRKDPDVSVNRTAQMCALHVGTLVRMVEAGEVPAPFQYHATGTRFYTYEQAVAIRKLIEAKRAGKS